MEFLNSMVLIIGFGAVVYTNLKTHQSVIDFHNTLKLKLDDVINDMNDINNHLIEFKSEGPDK